MRLDQIEAILAFTKELFEDIQVAKYAADHDPTIQNIPKVKVKVIFEQLRSVLDYTANDIRELLSLIALKENITLPNKEFYFPFGADLTTFHHNLGIYRDPLEDYLEDVYQLIEEMQPHISNDQWLIVLCKNTNYYKHNQLKYQHRNVKGFLAIPGYILSGTVREDLLGQHTLGSNVPKTGFRSGITITEAPDNQQAEFYTQLYISIFDEKTKKHWDIVTLLGKAMNEIESFVKKLYPILEAKKALI